MKKVFVLLFSLFTIHSLIFTGAYAADTPSKPKPPVTPEAIEKGKVVYFKRCSFCHGLLGDGNGPAADYMDPRPRDFTLGTFKFRTTQSGELPTDEDLFRTVSRGLSGTGMQSFDSDRIKNGLSEEERWQVIYYIKTFAQEFSDPNLDPYKKVVSQSKKVAFSDESVAKGKEIFERAKCWECHGKGGKGDGVKEARKDDWGFPIRIRNVTQPWKIKAGSEPEDIYMRFSTGISGTPMPSFVDTLKEEDRWHLANFIKSLQKTPSEQSVMKAVPVKELPDTPDSPEWQKAAPVGVRLAGQVVAAPRWQNPSIDMITVRVLYSDKEIAFLLEWDDPFKDVIHKSEMELDPAPLTGTAAYNSYAGAQNVVPRLLDTYRDSIAMQFPVKPSEGTKKPHFFRGDSSNPVNYWVWKADLEEAGQPSIEDSNAVGYKQAIKAQLPESQNVKGKGVWKEGVWRVVMKRPLRTEDKNDVQFEKGKFVPFSLNAWDGSNGEHNLLMSLSTWNYVVMEAPVPASVYLYTMFGIIGVGGVELWIFRTINGKRPETGKS